MLLNCEAYNPEYITNYQIPCSNFIAKRMFDYRRMAIEFSESLFGSILERFESKVPKLKYPDEYTSYTREMYHKYDQIMDQFDILFQKMETAYERLSICQKNQFLFLQLMKISDETTNFYEIERIIQNTGQLQPSEEYLFKFYKRYYENKKALQEIKSVLNISQEPADLVFKVIDLNKDLARAKSVINEKTEQIKQLKVIVQKISTQVYSKVQEKENMDLQNKEIKADISRCEQTDKLQDAQIDSFMAYKIQQITELKDVSELHYTFFEEIQSINATIQSENDKLLHSNQVLRDTIVRLNVQKKQQNEQINKLKTVYEAENERNLQKIENLIQKQQQIYIQFNEEAKKNKELNQRNNIFNNNIQQYIRDKYQLYKENQRLKMHINQFNQTMLQQINHKNQQLTNIKTAYNILVQEYQRFKVEDTVIISTLNSNMSALTAKYENQSKQHQQQVKQLSAKIQSLKEGKGKLLDQIKEFQGQLLQNVNLINTISQEKEMQSVKILQLKRDIDNLTYASLKLRKTIEKYEPFEQLWIIMDDDTVELIVEEKTI